MKEQAGGGGGQLDETASIPSDEFSSLLYFHDKLRLKLMKDVIILFV